MSITHNLDYCVSSAHQKKIETFLIGNNNLNITRNKNKPKMEFVILDTPVEIVNDYAYVIKAWLYDSQQRYGKYYGCYQGNHYCTFFETEDDARIEYNNAIQTNKFSKVMLIRIDPDANEDRETIIDEWDRNFMIELRALLDNRYVIKQERYNNWSNAITIIAEFNCNVYYKKSKGQSEGWWPCRECHCKYGCGYGTSKAFDELISKYGYRHETPDCSCVSGLWMIKK